MKKDTLKFILPVLILAGALTSCGNPISDGELGSKFLEEFGKKISSMISSQKTAIKSKYNSFNQDNYIVDSQNLHICKYVVVFLNDIQDNQDYQYGTDPVKFTVSYQRNEEYIENYVVTFEYLYAKDTNEMTMYFIANQNNVGPSTNEELTYYQKFVAEYDAASNVVGEFCLEICSKEGDTPAYTYAVSSNNSLYVLKTETEEYTNMKNEADANKNSIFDKENHAVDLHADFSKEFADSFNA